MSRPSDMSRLGPLYLRWERMEKARRDQQKDLKELFAEAKSHGLNTKALRAAFLAAYADEYDDAEKRGKREEVEADVEFYRDALARVREARAFGADADGVIADDEHEPRTASAPAVQAEAVTADTGSNIAAGGDAADTPAPNSPETAHEAPERSGPRPSDPPRSEAATREDAGPAAPVTKRNPTFDDPPHPDCRRPSHCGGFSQLGLCETCRAAAHGEVAA